MSSLFWGSVVIMDTIYGGNLINVPLLPNLYPKECRESLGYQLDEVGFI